MQKAHTFNYGNSALSSFKVTGYLQFNAYRVVDHILHFCLLIL